MKKELTFLLTFIFSVNLYSQATFVFFGSYNRATSTDGIYVFRLDTSSGELIKVSANNAVFNPSYLTLSPNGKFLYACTESQTKNTGSVSSYGFDAENGRLNFLNSQKSGGENPVYLTVNKSEKWLVNGNYTGGSVSVYPLSEDGKIGSLSQIFEYSEGSGHTKQQDRSHVHSIVFSPEQDYIFSPDLGADKIRSYHFDSLKTQPLQAANSTKSALGSGPRHLVFHPNGQYAYCTEELTGAISVFQYKNSNLDSIQRIITHPIDYTGLVAGADIHVSPDGKFLYTSNRGNQNDISIFSIRKNGTLKSIGSQSSLGNHPRSFAIDPSGRFLIVANMISGNVFVFKRNIKTGLLTQAGSEIKIKNVSCVKIRQY